jgi:hypothetical protein
MESHRSFRSTESIEGILCVFRKEAGKSVLDDSVPGFLHVMMQISGVVDADPGQNRKGEMVWLRGLASMTVRPCFRRIYENEYVKKRE